MQNKKSAVLSKNRDQLMYLVDSSKLKRANSVKVYKDFTSVVKFIDENGNDVDAKEGAVLMLSVLKGVVTEDSEKPQANNEKPQASGAIKGPPKQKLKQPSQGANQNNSVTQLTDLDEEKSHYWNAKFV